jgi:tetratricopeptide (TPR) repeat protein
MEVRMLLGEFSIDLNDYDSARNIFMAILDLEPENFRANLGVGRIWTVNSYWRQAVAYLERAEAGAPSDRAAEAKRLLALAYDGSGYLDRAIAKLEEAISIAPNDKNALAAIIQMRFKARKYDDAIRSATDLVKLATDAVKIAPSDKLKLMELVNAHDLMLLALGAKRGAPGRLQSLYRVDVSGVPTDQLKEGNELEAANVLNLIAEAETKKATIMLTLAYHDALIAAQRAVEYDPKNVQYLENLAVLYAQTAYSAEAVETFRKILEIDPKHQGALNYLRQVGAQVE